MTEKYTPLTKDSLFYVDDETDLIMYGKSEDEYQASMEWEGVPLVDVRSAVMGYTNRLEEIFKNAENHFEETSKELPDHIHDYFQSILDKTIIAVWESKDIWFPVFFRSPLILEVVFGKLLCYVGRLRSGSDV